MHGQRRSRVKKGPATSHPSSARRGNPQFPGRCYSSFRGYETRRGTWSVAISETEARTWHPSAGALSGPRSRSSCEGEDEDTSREGTDVSGGIYTRRVVVNLLDRLSVVPLPARKSGINSLLLYSFNDVVLLPIRSHMIARLRRKLRAEKCRYWRWAHIKGTPSRLRYDELCVKRIGHTR